MCLIVAQRAGAAPMSIQDFDNAWACNNDGAGYCFAENGALVVRKPFFKLRDLKREYAFDHARHGKQTPFILHFRFATHGAKNEMNTHPFILSNERIAMAHNGVLVSPNRNVSDTRFFVNTVLAFRDPAQVYSADFLEYLEELIGEFNKLAFLRDDGEMRIVNEDAGTWIAESWFSNLHWIPIRKTKRGARAKWDDLRARAVALWDDGDVDDGDDAIVDSLYDETMPADTYETYMLGDDDADNPAERVPDWRRVGNGWECDWSDDVDALAD